MGLDPLYISHFVESIFFGIYTALFLVAVYVLVTKRFTANNIILLIVTVVMYGIAAVHAILSVQVHGDPFKDLSDLTTSMTVVEGSTLLVKELPIVNYALGDGIVIWRAWAIWGQSYRVILLPLMIVITTVGVVVAQLVLTFAFGHSPMLVHEGLVLHTVVVSLTLSVNIVGTVLIKYRAWLRHRGSTVYRVRFGRDRNQAILTLLAESGAVYCGIWIAYLVLIFTSGDFVTTPCVAFMIFDRFIPQIVGIYPTLVIVLCSLQHFNHSIYARPSMLTAASSQRTMYRRSTAPGASDVGPPALPVPSPVNFSAVVEAFLTTPRKSYQPVGRTTLTTAALAAPVPEPEPEPNYIDGPSFFEED